MNYYEELGVANDAPAEEIRQAFKTLVRLLHPDGQTDVRVRTMAGRQMQRLNGILEILTDPRSRREYDESLQGPRALVPGGPGPVRPFPGRPAGRPRSGLEPMVSLGSAWVQTAVRYWFWVLVGTTCAATAAVWLAMPPASGPEVLPVRPAWKPVQVPVLSGVLPQDEPPRRALPGKGKGSEDQYPPQAFVDSAAPNRIESRSIPDPLLSARVQLPLPEAPGEPLAMPRVVPRTDPMEARPAEARQSEAPPLQVPHADVPVRTRPPAPDSRFAGNWLYRREPGETTDPGAYPAVYVEFLIAEEEGNLVGSYRAKYKVVDQALSPEVTMRVRGKAPVGNSVRAEWNSPGGAKGLVEMTLRSPAVMSVAWWTTEFGRQLQLTSGTAVLVRQQAP